jgi:hypothetical protein
MDTSINCELRPGSSNLLMLVQADEMQLYIARPRKSPKGQGTPTLYGLAMHRGSAQLSRTCGATRAPWPPIEHCNSYDVNPCTGLSHACWERAGGVRVHAARGRRTCVRRSAVRVPRQRAARGMRRIDRCSCCRGASRGCLGRVGPCHGRTLHTTTLVKSWQ